VADQFDHLRGLFLPNETLQRHHPRKESETAARTTVKSASIKKLSHAGESLLHVALQEEPLRELNCLQIHLSLRLWGDQKPTIVEFFGLEGGMKLLGLDAEQVNVILQVVDSLIGQKVGMVRGRGGVRVPMRNESRFPDVAIADKG